MTKKNEIFLFSVIFQILILVIFSHSMPHSYEINEQQTERRFEYSNPTIQQSPYSYHSYAHPPNGYSPYAYPGFYPFQNYFYPNQVLQPHYVDFNARNQKNIGLGLTNNTLNLGYQQNKQVTAKGASNDQFNRVMDEVFGK